MAPVARAEPRTPSAAMTWVGRLSSYARGIARKPDATCKGRWSEPTASLLTAPPTKTTPHTEVVFSLPNHAAGFPTVSRTTRRARRREKRARAAPSRLRVVPTHLGIVSEAPPTPDTKFLRSRSSFRRKLAEKVEDSSVWAVWAQFHGGFGVDCPSKTKTNMASRSSR